MLDVNCATRTSHDTALHIACLWGNLRSVETLVSAGANLNAKNTLRGETPLHMLTSTTRGKSIALRVEAAKKMIAAGCDLTVTNDMGVMAYQLMDEADDPEYLELKKTITPSSIFAGGGGGGSSSSS